MPHHLRLLGVLVLILTLGFAGSASAQSFSNVVVFGDSLSDSGNVAQALGLPPGTSFTTNPDPVWAEIVAEAFGASGKIPLAGGSNYAFGGACMNPATPCDFKRRADGDGADRPAPLLAERTPRPGCALYHLGRPERHRRFRARRSAQRAGPRSRGRGRERRADTPPP